MYQLKVVGVILMITVHLNCAIGNQMYVGNIYGATIVTT